uniref:Uncharacterized protein n=1 Tax=Setaria digitata TaxID=48799 RepID=A0A915PRV6_9BILA
MRFNAEVFRETFKPQMRRRFHVISRNSTCKFSKSSEEDSAYAGFGSSSPLSSAESSSMSLNSTSSKNSSCSGTAVHHPRTRGLSALSFQHSTGNHRFTGGTIQPPPSPHESKPILAVKGIAAPKVAAHLTPPSSKYTSPASTSPKNSPTTEGASPSKWPSSASDSEEQQPEVSATVATLITAPVGNTLSTLTTTKTSKGVIPSQSPTVGVVSPMMSHRVIKSPQASNNITDGDNQSDTSTTSGSRDSDNASVIYNPNDETNTLSNNSISKVVALDKKAPPVPVRTNSRLETTFDSNCGVTTAEVSTPSKTNMATFSGSDLEGIRPMEPIIPLVPPSYNVVVRNTKICQQNTHSPGTRNGTLRDSSTSDDSLDSISTTIRCAVPHRPSGYLSEGESLFTGNVTLPELSMADVSNGYMSEGGITVYARKMQARFKEGLEAVRDSMRHRKHDFNDRLKLTLPFHTCSLLRLIYLSRRFYELLLQSMKR